MARRRGIPWRTVWSGYDQAEATRIWLAVIRYVGAIRHYHSKGKITVDVIGDRDRKNVQAVVYGMMNGQG